MQAIADAADGGQQFDRKRGVDFLPQATDIHIDHIRFAFKVIVPDMLLDQLARDDLVGMVQQVFEQRKFFWGEIDGPPLSLDGVRDRIGLGRTESRLSL